MMLLASVVVVSVAAVTCSSLALVNGVLKRKAVQDEIDGRPSPVPPVPKPPPDPDVLARSFAEQRAILKEQRAIWWQAWKDHPNIDERGRK